MTLVHRAYSIGMGIWRLPTLHDAIRCSDALPIGARDIRRMNSDGTGKIVVRWRRV